MKVVNWLIVYAYFALAQCSLTFSATPTENNSAQNIASRLDSAPGLQCSLFAAEPDVVNPAAIDVDHRGRVWVCEIVNYRARQGARPKGDRIVILQDNDGDGRADESTVFYQGNDINSPHGVCVMGTPDGPGTKVIVSAGSRVVMLVDDDGDDRADRQEDLFTGIEGVQDDHGIHAVMFGPDGRLYFNCGNRANVIHDREGKSIRDLAGNVVSNKRNPYQQGMAFRCNPNGSKFETIAWNFRNPWMLTVDSFGNVWQSDNDDDGNRSCRLNFLVEYGNYGYRDELTGAGWQASRTGQQPELPLCHWHVNDPGTMPSVIYTGSGAPAGITVYEGKLLSDLIPGGLLHCEPGHGVVRAYTLKGQGAGYYAETTDVVAGSHAQWFRPVDVKVAPDGSLFIADWSDPAVGGHQAADLKQGRIVRVTRADRRFSYEVPDFDFDSAEGAVAALANPCFAVRALAWHRIKDLGQLAEPPLAECIDKENALMRARSLWVLGAISDGPSRQKYVEIALNSSDPRLRIVGLRLARQHQIDIVSIVKKLQNDQSPHVQRELAIALAHNQSPNAAVLWAQLASKYRGNDRWLLESLGIGARGKWDDCLAEWRKLVDADWSKPPLVDIVWRSRAAQTAELLQNLIVSTSSCGNNPARYIRALDFQESKHRSDAFANLLKLDPLPSPGVVVESLQRRKNFQLSENPSVGDAIKMYLAEHKGSNHYHSLIRRFKLTDYTQELLIQLKDVETSSNSVEAARTLLTLVGPRQLLAYVEVLGEEKRIAVAMSLGQLNDKRICQRMRDWMLNESLSLSLRNASMRSLSTTRAGLLTLLDIVRQEQLPDRYKFRVTQALYGTYNQSIVDQAKQLLPPIQSMGEEELPPLFHLVKERGDSNRGKEVFEKTGTCAKCHRVNGEGKQVGPDLSEIGGKLSREALYQAILDPSAGINHNYEQYVVLLETGISASGLLISETDEAVTLRNGEGTDTTYPKGEIDEFFKSDLSLMPANLQKMMSREQLVDLVEYLTTLKKKLAERDNKVRSN